MAIIYLSGAPEGVEPTAHQASNLSDLIGRHLPTSPCIREACLAFVSLQTRVGSYPTVSPLPRFVSEAVCFLLRSLSSEDCSCPPELVQCRSPALFSTLLCDVRTFLYAHITHSDCLSAVLQMFYGMKVTHFRKSRCDYSSQIKS